MHEPWPILRVRAGQPPTHEVDQLTSEEPLEIRVDGRAIAVTMRTPGPVAGDPDQHDRELAAGFLLAEGVITRRDDIHRIEPCFRASQGNVINVQLSPGVAFDVESLQRNVFVSSSCGVCGKASIDSVHARFPPLDANDSHVTSAGVLFTLPEKLRAVQATFEQTGGLHAAGLFDFAGNLIAHREDVGRHNAVDKLLGRALLENELPLADRILLVSGRASFEIMQKSLAGRVPVVAAVSAPSHLAASFAADSGQTLVGFLRDGRMNLYTHAGRVR